MKAKNDVMPQLGQKRCMNKGTRSNFEMSVASYGRTILVEKQNREASNSSTELSLSQLLIT